MANMVATMVEEQWLGRRGRGCVEGIVVGMAEGRVGASLATVGEPKVGSLETDEEPKVSRW
jgi:hypothetical protein